jgi:hypothetical protein
MLLMPACEGIFQDLWRRLPFIFTVDEHRALVALHPVISMADDALKPDQA